MLDCKNTMGEDVHTRVRATVEVDITVEFSDEDGRWPLRSVPEIRLRPRFRNAPFQVVRGDERPAPVLDLNGVWSLTYNGTNTGPMARCV
jgi:hypothetical protein